MSDSLLDHPLISARYFFPRSLAVPRPFVVTVDGAQLHCYRAAPHAEAPTVLHFHGNGEVAADWIHHFATPLVEAGLNVVLAEYRGYGGSTGEPGLVRMLGDALDVTDATQAPLGKLVVYGRSVGSLYAVHVAAHRGIAGLILEGSISDLLPRLTMRLQASDVGTSQAELSAAVKAAFDQRAKISDYAGPLLLIHARDDDLVPPSNATDFAGWAGDRAQLHLLHPGDHNSLHYYHAAWLKARVLEFVHAAVKA